GQSAIRQAGVGRVRRLSALRRDPAAQWQDRDLERGRGQSGDCRMRHFSKILGAVAVVASLALPVAHAQQVPLQDKPFAVHKIVVQVSENDPRKQALVISVAHNLLKFYDPDKVAVEVVAFGPGIDLLRGESASRKQVESLIAQGVRFDVCLNTLDTVERETGKRPDIMPGATPVQVGVGQILFLTENGYTLVRP